MASEALTWTVTTWNVRGSHKPDIARLADAIRIEKPDVVVIQEIRRSQAIELARLLSMRFTWALKHYPYTPLLRGAAEGLALLTPHALDAAGNSEVSDGFTKWTYKRRIAQWALIGRPDMSAYRVYNLHLAPGGRAKQRREQALSIVELVESHGDTPPVILAGDFNDNNDSTIIYALPGVEHISSPKTNPADTPTRALDHVLLPPDARDVAITVPAGSPEWAELSDHLPVTVRFSLEWVKGDFT